MPTYEYECRACSGRIEVVQKMTDDPLTECESCGGSLRKLLFPAGIIFKGSGFYVTDYKNKENGKGAGRNGTGATATASGTDATTTSEKKETPEKKESSAKEAAPAAKSD
jgi:putative FmdB family regulatory protein